MWFGSQFGLHRYDGVRVKTFFHDQNDSGTIASNYVEHLYVSPDGSLWVGTFGAGLDKFDYASETFSHVDYLDGAPMNPRNGLVSAIVETEAGALWIATHEGLYQYDIESGDSRAFRSDPSAAHSLSHDLCRVLPTCPRRTHPPTNRSNRPGYQRIRSDPGCINHPPPSGVPLLP